MVLDGEGRKERWAESQDERFIEGFSRVCGRVSLELRSAVTSSSQRGELLPLRSPKGDALKALF